MKNIDGVAVDLKKPNHAILHMAKDYPTSLWNMEAISEKVKVPYERVKTLTEAGYMPHYIIDGGEPMYKLAEVKSWLSENLIQHCRGKKFPIKFKLNVKMTVDGSDELIESPPDSIAGNHELLPMRQTSFPPGIYFLCEENEVVYVGQSVLPANRVQAHMADKKFDRSFLLPVPREYLDKVEAAFIRALKPRLNGRSPTGKMVTNHPKKNGDDNLYVQKYGDMTIATVPGELS